MRRTRQGFTVLEVLIAATILMVMLGSIGWVVVSSRNAYHGAIVDTDLDARARRALDRIADQLADAGVATLLPPPTTQFGSAQIDYRRCAGANAGAVAWNWTSRLSWRIEAGEVDNGADDDSDGLVDEGEVVLIQDLGTVDERTIRMTGYAREYLEGEVPNNADDNGNGLIDERGLCFSLVEDLLTIRLTLERIDTNGRTSTRTVTTAVRLRN